jgi:hypothetical protein
MFTVLAKLVLLGNAHAQFLNPEQTQEEQERQIEQRHYQNQMMEQQRADQGDSNAQNNLGVLYYICKVSRRIMSARTCGSTWRPQVEIRPRQYVGI